ncbi:uncharacterized protein LOC116603333 [Nematostella vectensis]|uniref:uncharacterized protein LOC116603333 n=1 Tax=Nematostella vectensis TaxID=45351 RepID=UPI00207792EF|nr:uncharacterized protein LOC116603333 [Nematostella vectensis]
MISTIQMRRPSVPLRRPHQRQQVKKLQLSYVHINNQLLEEYKDRLLFLHDHPEEGCLIRDSLISSLKSKMLTLEECFQVFREVSWKDRCRNILIAKLFHELTQLDDEDAIVEGLTLQLEKGCNDLLKNLTLLKAPTPSQLGIVTLLVSLYNLEDLPESHKDGVESYLVDIARAFWPYFMPGAPVCLNDNSFIDAVSDIFGTVGEILDKDGPKNMERTFNQITRLLYSVDQISNYARMRLMQLKELRAAKWKLRPSACLYYKDAYFKHMEERKESFDSGLPDTPTSLGSAGSCEDVFQSQESLHADTSSRQDVPPETDSSMLQERQPRCNGADEKPNLKTQLKHIAVKETDSPVEIIGQKTTASTVGEEPANDYYNSDTTNDLGYDTIDMSFCSVKESGSGEKQTTGNHQRSLSLESVMGNFAAQGDQANIRQRHHSDINNSTKDLTKDYQPGRNSFVTSKRKVYITADSLLEDVQSSRTVPSPAKSDNNYRPRGGFGSPGSVTPETTLRERFHPQATGYPHDGRRLFAHSLSDDSGTRQGCPIQRHGQPGRQLQTIADHHQRSQSEAMCPGLGVDARFSSWCNSWGDAHQCSLEFPVKSVSPNGNTTDPAHYSRDFLLSLALSPAAMTRPESLSNTEDWTTHVILTQTRTVVDRFRAPRCDLPLLSTKIGALKHSQPSPEHSQPSPEHSLPSQEHSLPSPEHSQPSPEHSQPSPEHSQPSPEHSQPSPEHSQPSPEHCQPSPEHSQPSPEHSLPSQEHSLPSPTSSLGEQVCDVQSTSAQSYTSDLVLQTPGGAVEHSLASASKPVEQHLVLTTPKLDTKEHNLPSLTFKFGTSEHNQPQTLFKFRAPVHNSPSSITNPGTQKNTLTPTNLPSVLSSSPENPPTFNFSVPKPNLPSYKFGSPARDLPSTAYKFGTPKQELHSPTPTHSTPKQKPSSMEFQFGTQEDNPPSSTFKFRAPVCEVPSAKTKLQAPKLDTSEHTSLLSSPPKC